MRLDDDTANSMVETINLLAQCVDSLLKQLMQYESIDSIENWLPELEAVERCCEDYGVDFPFDTFDKDDLNH